MGIVVVIIMLLVGFSFLLKLASHGWPGIALWTAVAAIFILLSRESATAQSKNQISDWLEQPELMLDTAVWLTMDVAFQMYYCVLAVRSSSDKLRKSEQVAYQLCWWIPGLLIFPVLFAAHTELVFTLTGTDFAVIAWSMAACLLVIIPLLETAIRWLIPESDIRIELLFMLNLLIAFLGIIATVNGRTAAAGTNHIEWLALLGTGIIIAVGAVAGILYNKYITHKKLSKSQ